MGTIKDMLTTEYDGCGNCLVATRRLSRKTDRTNSPERQADRDIRAAIDAGGHIIAWADDWEISGATDPLTRPGLGPWLRGEMGPYGGLAGPSVDRIGRNIRDTLNTQDLLTKQGRKIFTADHAGVGNYPQRRGAHSRRRDRKNYLRNGSGTPHAGGNSFPE